MTLAIMPFVGGFEVVDQHQAEPPTAAAATTDARQLRRLALDAVARFRRVVDDADERMEALGAGELKGWRRSRPAEQFEATVKRAADETGEAIRLAHLATGAPDHNHLIIDDSGDTLVLCDTTDPFPDERTFFEWPYLTVRTSQAIQPARD